MFYTITYSTDNDGYYAEVFDSKGKDIATSDIIYTTDDIIDWVKSNFPRAKLVKKIHC